MTAGRSEFMQMRWQVEDILHDLMPRVPEDLPAHARLRALYAAFLKLGDWTPAQREYAMRLLASWLGLDWSTHEIFPSVVRRGRRMR